MLCQAEDLEVLGDGCLDDLFKGVIGVAGAELARVAVVGEWHFVGLGIFSEILVWNESVDGSLGMLGWWAYPA